MDKLNETFPGSQNHERGQALYALKLTGLFRISRL